MEKHREEVTKVAAKVKQFYERKEGFRIHQDSTNSTRKSAHGRDSCKVVDTSNLKHVLYADTESQTCLVEPNVPMDCLVEETLKYGLVPPVVMEFPGITVEGGYSGTSGESSSFKYGFFDRTIKQVEMVLANGDVISASEFHNADLFRGAAGVVGTFRVVTMVELQLRKATKLVEATYHRVASTQEATEKLLHFTASPNELDYIDGIMFSRACGAIITAHMTDAPSAQLSIQSFSDAKDPWFFLHVKVRIESSLDPVTEAIPLTDYLFRYDRGFFWVGRAAFDHFGLSFNKFTRWVLDDFMHTRILYNTLQASGQSERMIVQDLALPYTTAADFVERMDETLGIWPVWLCPLKQSPHPTMHPHLADCDADGSLKPMLNIGVWGRLPSHCAGRFVQANLTLKVLCKSLVV